MSPKQLFLQENYRRKTICARNVINFAQQLLKDNPALHMVAWDASPPGPDFIPAVHDAKSLRQALEAASDLIFNATRRI